MCGIAGEIDFRPNQPERQQVYETMRDSLSPRGPDAAGIVNYNFATLIHTRLAVVDLEGGIQPMSRNNHTIVYNGELYNTEELRFDLLKAGYTFEGHSDTEVLLCSYLHWGKDCLARLNGIFAFAIWSEKEEKLFFARDRMGVKPLFYCEQNGMFLFSSEIKGLLAHPDVKAEISHQSFAQLLLLGPGRKSGQCVFSQISEVKAGYYGTFSREGLILQQYWTFQNRTPPPSLDQAIEEVRFLVRDAITRQVQCDVPVCTFLSGGIDSSIITAVAAEILAQEGITLHSYSVDYQDNDRHFLPSHFQPSRDQYYIDLVSKRCKTIHHNVMLDTPQLIEALFSAVESRDVPGMADVDSSLLLFCKEVKKDATVALSGECADELFGGYPWFRDPNMREKTGFPWARNTEYRLSFLHEDLQDKFHGKHLINQYYEETISQVKRLDSDSSLDHRMKEMTRLNTDWFMQTLLERKDRMSMANGLEVRVPFCDYRIAELLYSLPWDWKEYEGYEKGILRKAMEGLLPDEVLWRKKSPYPKTYNPNYRQGVSDLLREIISDSSSPLLQLVSKNALIQLLDQENTTPWYGQLMTTPQTIAYFVQMNHWLKHYHITVA